MKGSYCRSYIQRLNKLKKKPVHYRSNMNVQNLKNYLIELRKRSITSHFNTRRSKLKKNVIEPNTTKKTTHVNIYMLHTRTLRF